jgi:hypothetical protein
MWTHNGSWGNDSDAFVFNLENKYTPNDTSKAIYNYDQGGRCLTGKNRYYDIEGAVSPLTGEKDKFTVSALEVYKVIY